MDRLFSDRDLWALSGGATNIVTYKELPQYRSLDDLLYKGACCILVEMKPNQGHWICIFKQGKDKIQFFDPYSIYIDDQLDFIPERFAEKTGQTYPYLTKLLYDSKYKVHYNEYPLQNKGKPGGNINTCGRWCGVRLLLKKDTEDQFASRFMGKGKNPDKIITKMSDIILSSEDL